ncbi:hypothetical protein KKB43_03100 [Patescibacteria group bacterium]|nr:hypothetical protein [Patescibacteria group bacterium]MBU4579981.1 hypothetical protein [Patescibacteria group bacterium]
MDKEIYIHPIFNDLLNNLRFFFVGINMMSMPDFQNALITDHKGEKSTLEISVKYDDLKCIKYDIRDVFDSFNKVVGLELVEDKVHANIMNLMNFQARQIAISLFNILENSDFNNSINKEEIFKFANHIRNGAAHNNKFNFNKKTTSELPVSWKNKRIESSLHGTEVFNKFLTPADLILLISDFSNIIKNYK